MIAGSKGTLFSGCPKFNRNILFLKFFFENLLFNYSYISVATSIFKEYCARKDPDIGQPGVHNLDSELLLHWIHGKISDSIL